jgi:hypothetical protein
VMSRIPCFQRITSGESHRCRTCRDWNQFRRKCQPCQHLWSSQNRVGNFVQVVVIQVLNSLCSAMDNMDIGPFIFLDTTVKDIISNDEGPPPWLGVTAAGDPLLKGVIFALSANVLFLGTKLAVYGVIDVTKGLKLVIDENEPLPSVPGTTFNFTETITMIINADQFEASTKYELSFGLDIPDIEIFGISLGSYNGIAVDLKDDFMLTVTYGTAQDKVDFFVVVRAIWKQLVTAAGSAIFDRSMSIFSASPLLSGQTLMLLWATSVMYHDRLNHSSNINSSTTSQINLRHHFWQLSRRPRRYLSNMNTLFEGKTDWYGSWQMKRRLCSLVASTPLQRMLCMALWKLDMSVSLPILHLACFDMLEQEIDAIADAMKNGLNMGVDEVAGTLISFGHDITQVGDVLSSVFNVSPQEVASALISAGVAVEQAFEHAFGDAAGELSKDFNLVGSSITSFGADAVGALGSLVTNDLGGYIGDGISDLGEVLHGAGHFFNNVVHSCDIM